MSQYAYHHEKAEQLLKDASQMQGGPADRCVQAAQVHAQLAQAEAIQETVTMLDDARGALGYVGESLADLVKQVRR